MFTRGWALCLVLAFATVVQADAVIELVPDIPGPYYVSGQRLNVDFRLRVDPVETDPLLIEGIYVRQLQFDMSRTSWDITLNSFAFNFAEAQRICGLVSSMCGNGYEQFLQLDNADGAVVTATLTASAPHAMTQLIIPTDGTSVSVGMLELNLPTRLWSSRLDVLSAWMDDTENCGAQLVYGFGGADGIPSQSRYPMSGGILVLESPEPATLTLLAVGGLVFLRRRRS